ncbi:hypothetical protein PG990_002054 [Apiospora arundinis]
MASYMESIPRPTKTYHTKPYPRLSQDHGFEGAGKTVLVTGGAGGVGLAISRAFAEAGVSRLVIVARSAGPQAQVKAELEAAHPGLEVLTYAASITDRDSTAKILKDLGESGGLDVLVLCAAVAHRRITAAEVSPQEVRDAFEINTIAAFDWTQTYLSSPSPKAKTVINVSAAAAQMRHPMRAAYGPSKAAVVQIMQAFAAEVDWKQKSQPVEEKTRIFLVPPGVALHPRRGGAFRAGRAGVGRRQPAGALCALARGAAQRLLAWALPLGALGCRGADGGQGEVGGESGGFDDWADTAVEIPFCGCTSRAGIGWLYLI